VFSLGIILFELLYPMYTGMERNICLNKLRESRFFPSDWHASIGAVFPDLEDMIRQMVVKNPSARPTSESVAKHVGNILGEFTVLSLDVNHNSDPDIFMLRVEAEHREDTLGHTMRQIHEITAAFSFPDFETSPHVVTIVQYGLRSSSSIGGGKALAIMEFAIKFSNSISFSIQEAHDENRHCIAGDSRQRHMNLLSRLIGKLMERPGVYKVRQISWATA
jgi:serine/threonine protein kinase